MTIVFVGIDLAKNVFAVHGVDAAGKPVLVRPSVARDKLLELIASLPPCTVAMEACSGAHHWARLFMALGHTVRLIAPKFVTPYRMTGRRGGRWTAGTGGGTRAGPSASITSSAVSPMSTFPPPRRRLSAT